MTEVKGLSPDDVKVAVNHQLSPEPDVMHGKGAAPAGGTKDSGAQANPDSAQKVRSRAPRRRCAACDAPAPSQRQGPGCASTVPSHLGSKTALSLASLSPSIQLLANFRPRSGAARRARASVQGALAISPFGSRWALRGAALGRAEYSAAVGTGGRLPFHLDSLAGCLALSAESCRGEHGYVGASGNHRTLDSWGGG